MISVPVINKYRISTFWRIFLYVSFTALIALFTWLAFDISTDAKSDIPPYVVILVALLLVLGCCYILLRTYKERLIITNNSFTHEKALSRQVLYFNEVKGFSINENSTCIIPNSAKKKIEITKYIDNLTSLHEYLANNFSNLDDCFYEDELNTILTDPSLGFTEADRHLKLKKAKLLCDYLNWPSYVLAGLLIFYPSPYIVLMTLGIIYPLLALIALKTNKLIRLDEDKNSAYPTIAHAFIMPFLGMIMRLVTDLSLLNFSEVWLPSLVLCLILIIIFMAGNSQFKFRTTKKLATTTLAGILIFMYAATAVITINCLYYKSVIHTFTVRVKGKHTSHSKTTSYYLELEKWGTQTEPDDEMVSSSLYNKTNIGNKVTVIVNQGLLGIQWYSIHQ